MFLLPLQWLLSHMIRHSFALFYLIFGQRLYLRSHSFHLSISCTYCQFSHGQRFICNTSDDLSSNFKHVFFFSCHVDCYDCNCDATTAGIICNCSTFFSFLFLRRHSFIQDFDFIPRQHTFPDFFLHPVQQYHCSLFSLRFMSTTHRTRRITLHTPTSIHATTFLVAIH